MNRKVIMGLFIVLLTVILVACTGTLPMPTQKYKLQIEVDPVGSGTVSPSTGSVFDKNTSVTLEVQPTNGFIFDKWGGVNGNDIVFDTQNNQYSIRMNSDKKVIAYFVALGSVATLSDIKIDGVLLNGFDSETLEYSVQLPYGTTIVPTVTATPICDKANVIITNAKELPGTTTIVVTAEDGLTSKTYSINFTVNPEESPEVTSISLETDKGQIIADGKDVATFSALVRDQNGNQMEVTPVFYQADQQLSDNLFKTTVAGSYIFTARIGTVVSNEVTVLATQSGIVNVPDDYTTISEAIEKVADGGYIEVSAGTYNETIVIDKPLTLTGEGMTVTTIDGQYAKDENNEPLAVITITANNVTISGFTITGGYPGIIVNGEYTLLKQNKICENIAMLDFESHGMGIRVNEDNCIIRNNLITNNTAENDGGSGKGIYIDTANSLQIENNTLVANNGCNGAAVGDGQGILAIDSTGTIINNIIVNHQTLDGGDGNGTGFGIKLENSNFEIDYNNVWRNGYWEDNVLEEKGNYYGCVAGEHDITVDPLFADEEAYYLKPESLCIDAGNPNSNYNNEPAPNGERINLGAYGNTSNATTTILIANAGEDQDVNTGDLVVLDGSASRFVNANTSCNWEIITKPIGSTTELSEPTTVNPTLIPDIEGEYIITLTLSDGIESSLSDEVRIYATTVYEDVFIFDDIPESKMVFVPGGTFEMGDEYYEGDFDERPVHSVTVSGFYMSSFEVTQELWERIMGTNPSGSYGAKKPVESVSWQQVIEFIEELNSLTGENYRLPTEAEWEYAAKGGQQYRYGSSDGTYSDGNSNSSGTKEVGSYAPNPFGIYDLVGNVWEWVNDWYAEDYYNEYLTDNWPDNPLGPATGTQKIIRGGGYVAKSLGSRSANRFPNLPNKAWDDTGFRLVKDL